MTSAQSLVKVDRVGYSEVYGDDMISVQVGTIMGASVGVELVTEEDDEIAWALIVDVVILRFVFAKFKE